MLSVTTFEPEEKRENEETQSSSENLLRSKEGEEKVLKD